MCVTEDGLKQIEERVNGRIAEAKRKDLEKYGPVATSGEDKTVTEAITENYNNIKAAEAGKTEE